MKRALIFTIISLFTLQLNAQDERTRVVIETDSGNIIVELYNETPLHRDNFIKLALDSFYNGTTFHRVIQDFMIQGGNPSTREGAPVKVDGPGYTIAAELNSELFHKKGALCAARLGDNVNPRRESSGSQFYIVQGRPFEPEDLKQFEHRINQDLRNKTIQAFFAAPENREYLDRIKKAKQESNQEEIKAIMDEINPIIDAKMDEKEFHYSAEQQAVYTSIGGTPHLDMQYTVFGEVVEGLEVVDKIAATKKNGEAPVAPIRMKVRLAE